MYIRNIKGPSTLPWETPANVFNQADTEPCTIVDHCLNFFMEMDEEPSQRMVEAFTKCVQFFQQFFVSYHVEGFIEVK